MLRIHSNTITTRTRNLLSISKLIKYTNGINKPYYKLQVDKTTTKKYIHRCKKLFTRTFNPTYHQVST